jgi:arylsulfatase
MAAATAAFAQAGSRPNVLVILTDDQGYGDFSCHGNPVLKTPEMDKLHASSIRLTDFHSAPMCTPTRGQLMSGVDALRNKATSVTAGRAVLRRDLPTMADVFRANGYRTAMFGKWHLGDMYPYRPHDRGFEVAKYHLGWGFSSAPEFDNDYFDGRYRDKGVVKQFRGYCTDFWFSEAIAWMGARKAASEPFFCYLPTNTPHAPNWVEAKYSEPYNKPGLPKEFFGMIANLDENLGKLEQFLAASGLRENTIVVFMTDNGGTQGVRVFNAGMRAAKAQIYDGGHRVPCFVRWPNGGLRPAGDVDTPAQMQDILPTLVDLCGLKNRAKFDGASLAPLLRGKGPVADRMLVVQYGQVPKKYDADVIWGKWRLVKGEELYDFKADVGETKNLAAAHPEVAAKMRAYYDGWWAAVEPGLAVACPLSIGAPQEDPVTLTSSDWWEIYADNVGHVSNAVGGPRGAHWTVAVERTGRYEIALSRWPFEMKLPLTAARPVQKMRAGSLPEGKALPIAGAKLHAAGQDLAAKSGETDPEVRFTVRLKKQASARLHGWFVDADGRDVSGAFYARVKYLGA